MSQPLPELRRALGLIDAAAIVAGTVIGTGIFLVPATVAREIGTVGGVFLVWVAGGLLSLAGALSYAELGAMFPEAGGEYAFLRRAYGPLWGFLFGWQQVVIGKTGSIASIAMAFAIFLGFFVPGIDSDWVALADNVALSGTQLIAILSIVMLTGLNYLGVAVGGRVQSALTILKVAAILALAAFAWGSGKGSWSHFVATQESSTHWFGFGAALAATLWSYDGWNNLTLVGAEVREPHSTIPRVLVLGLLGVMAVYLLTNLAYLYMLPLTQMAQSQRLAQEVAVAAVGDWGGEAITVAAVISTLAALNGSILTGARVSYAMARDRLFFRHMADLDAKHHSPVKALLLQCLFASILILILGHAKDAFERLFNYAVFGTWLFYGITALAVIVLRRRRPDLHRPYLTPGYPWIPISFILVATGFCLSLMLRRPLETGLGLALLAAGLPFYAFWHRASRR